MPEPAIHYKVRVRIPRMSVAASVISISGSFRRDFLNAKQPARERPDCREYADHKESDREANLYADSLLARLFRPLSNQLGIERQEVI